MRNNAGASLQHGVSSPGRDTQDILIFEFRHGEFSLEDLTSNVMEFFA
jgi:hypothetical protein